MTHILSLKQTTALFLFVALCASWWQSVSSADDAKPYGIDQRTPWTTSRITGSPDPPPPYQTERIYPRITFDQPVEMVFAPHSERVFVVERKGRIFRLPNEDDSQQRELFFDAAQEIAGLTAVYGLAFHPRFAENRLCYVCYILAPELPKGTRVSRFRVTNSEPPRIEAASEQILLEWPSGGHNGGSLKFGPDGHLFISTGDASPPSPPDVRDTGQDISDLAASILRIDVDREQGGKPYAVPADNPFIGVSGARGEVWAYGLRNPWRMSFDRQNGQLWLGDVGWQLWEMVYRIERGGNYGWSIVEGPQSVRPQANRGPTAISPPIIAHPRAEAASVTGGYVYRGKRLPKLAGAYIYGDYVTGKIWSLRYDGDAVTAHDELVDTTFAIIAFYEGPDGELALMDYNGGGIYRLVPNKQQDRNLQFPRRLSETGLFAATKDHRPAAGVIPFSINTPHWADHATAERMVAVPGRGTMTLRIPKERVPTGWGEFPQDTVLAKTLFLETERGNPASRRRVETQILHLGGNSWRGNSGEWNGYTYIWNDEQTDAVLAPAEGRDLQFDIADDQAPGGRRRQTWHVAGRGECYQCHNPWSGYRLAFTTAQLDKVHNYGRVSDSQLRTLRHIGILATPDEPKDRQAAPLVDPYNQLQDLDARARSYLHVNCAHCHRFGGGGTAVIDLRREVPLSETKLIEERPTQGTFNIFDARLVAPADPHRSLLYYRMAKRGAGRMPHIGADDVDQRAIAMIAEWIVGMPGRRNGIATKRREEARRTIEELGRTEGLSVKRREELIGALLGSTGGALRLMRAIDDGVLPRAVVKPAVALGGGVRSAADSRPVRAVRARRRARSTTGERRKDRADSGARRKCRAGTAAVFRDVDRAVQELPQDRQPGHGARPRLDPGAKEAKPDADSGEHCRTLQEDRS